MSDVSTAAAPPANAPAAPAVTEVAVTQNQTSTPAAIGSQAPDKPVGDIKGSEHRPQSRREAIQAAFDRAAKAEPAKPRMGHNNPPEPMAKEKPAEKEKPEPVDLRRRPNDQPREQGRFAARQPAEGEERRQDATPRPAQRQQYVNPLPVDAPYREPPQRMSDHAKAEWHTAPESVRGEVHRMHHEFGKAYQMYRGDHEVMNSIRPFHQMAQQHGTTLDRALSNYVNMEHKLRNDVVGGLDVIVNNLNLRAADGRKLTLQDVAWHIVNQTPEQHQLLQSSNKMMAQSHQMQQLRQEHAALAQQLAQMQNGIRFNLTRGAVDQYAETHPRLDELADLIEREINLGFDLDTAYRRAELLRPAGTQAAQTRTGTQAAQTRSPTAQTRDTDRSISGAPDAPSNGSRRSRDKPVGRRDAIQSAIRRVNGGL